MTTTNYADVALISMRHPVTGSILEFEEGESLSIELSRETKRVTTMNARRRSKGYKRGTFVVTAKLSVHIVIGVQPYDFREALANGTEFDIMYTEGENGNERRLVDCTVSGCSQNYDAEGGVMMDVSLEALDDVLDSAPLI